jgi:Fe2+ or Zn2+ uptake regulation protein
MKLTEPQLTVLDVNHRTPEPPTVREIVRQYLQDHGYHGLCNPALECGCGIDDLMPCDSNPFGCQPARHAVNEYGEAEYVLDDRPIGPVCDGLKALKEVEAKHRRSCREMEEVVDQMNMSRISPPVHGSHATIECACCHQVVGLSQSIYQNGQELCPKCAENAK